MKIINYFMYQYPSYMEYSVTKEGYEFEAQIPGYPGIIHVSIHKDGIWYYYTIVYGESFVISRTTDQNEIRKSYIELLIQGEK